ncbi:amidohydrolase [Enterococcus hermanniensis]|uniref:Amidohydrolase n=1 Tax=Enterococcus hermanniensis TaxID=249189 RepID=A0A1L8TJ80_9ENTE|nr:amidohydrolase [Enterococcus hermanniensis]OJG44369.1 amidohydrolase [Enterococcus hermanniensis]
MNNFAENLLSLVDSKKERMIEIRRYLHAHPELSFEEQETAKYIADFYQNLACTVKKNIGGYGIVVEIDSGKPGKNLALRADFDALPIQEETGLPFASENPGVMHACGHDAHTAYMLILAECLIELKEQFSGKITILHQPAEETPPGGAIQMIRDGCLDGVDHVVGCHVMSGFDLGTVYYHTGATQTGRATFKLKVQGKGSHGSMPNAGIDAVLVGSQIVVNLQSIVSRRVNPFDMTTLTVGSFDGKGSANVLKDAVFLEGDIRMMNEASRTLVKEAFEDTVKGICEVYGATYELDYVDDYPVLMNDQRLTEFVVNIIEQHPFTELKEVVDSGPIAPSEDFAYYCQERPSCFFYVGATGEGQVAYPHHHPKFDIDEASILIAAKTMATVVSEYFNQEK